MKIFGALPNRLQHAALALAIVIVATTPAQAARPLLDQHQWDRAFAVFARDSNVPWKPTTVRVETYSSAPIAFQAYAVDAADVIVAGRPAGRPIDTSKRKPIASWRFYPKPGYRVGGTSIGVPLGAREGVFVVQARRGAAVQQVWINRTRIGLVSKSAPEGLLVYGTDLGTGKPLAGMRMLFLVRGKLQIKKSDAHGVVRWGTTEQPKFVLAEWGASRAFLSFLPSAPVPAVLAGVRLDRAHVRAGGTVTVIGFARKRRNGHYASAGGTARIGFILRGKSLDTASVPLDSAGSFMTKLQVPQDAAGGDATILASVAGASAGANLHIDAGADVALTVDPECDSACSSNASVPVLLSAKRAGAAAVNVPLTIRVVRYPHVFPRGTKATEQESWGATTVFEKNLPTNANGRLRITIPAAGDGLPSTLGIRVSTPGSSSETTARLVLPAAGVAVNVQPERERVDPGETIAVSIHAFDGDDGRAVPGSVRVTVSHGPSHTTSVVKLDAHGRGRALFHHPQYGENLIYAELASSRGTAVDANSVQVAPSAFSANSARRTTIDVRTDRARYRPGAVVKILASASRANGTALVSIDDRHSGTVRTVPVSGNGVRGNVPLGDPQGAVNAAVAFVRDGAIFVGSTPLTIDGPGHERAIELRPSAAAYPIGTAATVDISDGSQNETATTIVRVTDGEPSGSADFSGAGEVLATGGTTTQTSASDDPPWHAWVSPKQSRARNLFTDFLRRPTTAEPPDLSDADAQVFSLKSVRAAESVHVALPTKPGRYVISILRMYDDGDVGAATTVVGVS